MAKKRTPPPPEETRDEDLSGPLPRELLSEWRDSSRSVNFAAELLKPALVEGIVLSGEGARLTGLEYQLEPAELAARVDRTKRVVHGIVTAAGGRAPGAPWTDAFQALFPAHAPVEFVIGAALEIHRRLENDPAARRVRIAVHRGTFYEVSGALYGDDAHLAEFLVEEFAQAGETLVTKAILSSLRARTRLTTYRRSDLDHLGTETHRVAPDAKLPAPLAMARAGGTYPLPYSQRFHDGLAEIDRPETWPGRRAILDETYGAERTVVMSELAVPGGTRPYDILEKGLRDTRLALSICRLLPEDGELIENAGAFVLTAFASPRSALDFALRLGAHYFDQDMQVQIGLDRGRVLLVPADEPGEPARVLGRPVYIASKLSHELGEPNRILLSESAAAGLTLPGTPAPFEHVIAAVPCAGVALDLGA